MVRVDPSLVLAGAQAIDASAEVIERHGEVPRVPPSGLQPEAGLPYDANPHEGEHLKSDQRRLLGELVHGHVSCSEDRDAVDAIDLVVALGVQAEHATVETAPSHDDDLIIVEPVTGTDMPLLRHCSSQAERHAAPSLSPSAVVDP